MPLLSGAVSVTRLDVTARPAEPVFDDQPFRSIVARSEVKESIGFVPFEPEADYQIGTDRWAFRVRIDQLRPDPTAVRERLRDLLRIEREEHGIEVVPPQRTQALRSLAEEELVLEAQPRSRIVEGVLDGKLLYLATTANNQLGKILQLLRKVEILADFKTPWNDLGQGDADSEILEIHDPHQSLHGSQFLKRLLGDQELMIEPSDGYVKLQTREARVIVSGSVLRELHRYVDAGAELLAAKLLHAEWALRLDALAFRISGLRLDRSSPGHWTERLDERLQKIEAVWELLDRKYAEKARAPRRHPAAARSRRSRTDREESDTPSSANVVPFER